MDGACHRLAHFAVTNAYIRYLVDWCSIARSVSRSMRPGASRMRQPSRAFGILQCSRCSHSAYDAGATPLYQEGQLQASLTLTQ